MLLRTLHITCLGAGLLAIGCSDKGGDSAPPEETAEPEDTDDTEEPEPEYLEPQYLYPIWGAGITNGAITIGKSYGSYFYLYLFTDAWDGDTESEEACIIAYDLSTAQPDDSFTDAAFGGWLVPADASYVTSSGCDNLEPTSWGTADEVATSFVSAYTWGVGIGLASELSEDLQKYLEQDKEYTASPDAQSAVFSSYLYHTVTGTTSVQLCSYGFVYSLEGGAVDTTSYVSLEDAQVLVDGYYSSTAGCGFQFQ